MKKQLKALGLNDGQIEYALILIRMGRTVAQAAEETIQMLEAEKVDYDAAIKERRTR